MKAKTGEKIKKKIPFNPLPGGRNQRRIKAKWAPQNGRITNLVKPSTLVNWVNNACLVRTIVIFACVVCILLFYLDFLVSVETLSRFIKVSEGGGKIFFFLIRGQILLQ